MSSSTEEPLLDNAAGEQKKTKMNQESVHLLSGADADTAGQTSSSYLLANFTGMAMMFSITHGCVVSCLSYASSELGQTKGAWGSGTLFFVYAFASLLISKPVVAMLGGKWALFAGLAGYCLYIGGFLFAVIFSGTDWLAWPVYMLTCVIGGLSGGLLWTAQGRYFTHNAKKYSDALEAEVNAGKEGRGRMEECEISVVNAKFAGMFALIYLGAEAVTKAAATAIFLTCGEAAEYIVFASYFVAALAGAFFFLGSSDLGDKGSGDVSFAATLNGVWDATTLLQNDRRIALMMPYQWAFGVCGSFISFYAFGTIVSGSDSLGDTWVGLLSALITLSGSTMALPFTRISTNYGKEYVMVLGGVCFAWVGSVMYYVSDETLGTWGWIIPFFIVFGMGRGAWESTNKAVIADLVVDTPQHTASAFACVSFNNGIFAAMAYYVFDYSSRLVTGTIVFVLALVGIVCYLMSARLHKEMKAAAAAGGDRMSDV